MTKIYTKAGDKGSTSLFSGEKVAKDDLLVQAYGTVDELNSVIGVARSLHTKTDRLGDVMCLLQAELFELGADLASGDQDAQRITDQRVVRLEQLIDEFTEPLPALTNFILPGGHPVAAQLHQARCVCRRAERLAVAARRQAGFNEVLIRYLNRLSDLLFTLARAANAVYQTRELPWTSTAEPDCSE